MKRLKVLDGLRGWGAVVVVLYHVFCDGLPLNEAIGEHLGKFVPFNGTLAVLVFFVVSGLSLSVRYLADGDLPALSRIAAGRYLRLAIPIFAACLVVHFVMVFGFVDAPADRLPKFRAVFNFEPTWAHLFRFSFFDVFFRYLPTETYIGPLWTMSVELIGSFVVLTTVVVARPIPGRLPLLLGLSCLILLLARTENISLLALFIIGALLADCFNRGWVDAIPKPAAISLLLVGCVAPIMFPYSVTAWGFIGAVPLVLGSVALPWTRNWLEGPVSIYLGRISFPLYLMHGPVLCCVGEPLMWRYGDALLLKVAIQFVVVVLSFVLAHAFLPINELALGVAHRFAKSVTNPLFGSSASTEP